MSEARVVCEELIPPAMLCPEVFARAHTPPPGEPGPRENAFFGNFLKNPGKKSDKTRTPIVVWIRSATEIITLRAFSNPRESFRVVAFLGSDL